MIVPVTWCQIPQFSLLRSMLLDLSLLELTELPTKVFADSDLDTSIYILENSPCTDATATIVKSCSDAEMPTESLQHDIGITVSKREWESEGGKLSFDYDPTVSRLLAKIRKSTVNLGSVFDYSQGIVPYARDELYRKLSKDEADRIVDERLWHSDHQKDEAFKRELRGDDVDRYHLEWNETQWVKYGPWLARPREPRYFTDPRILIQEITRGKRLRAAYTDEEFYNNPGVINVVSKAESDPGASPSLLFLLSLVNSSLLFFWHIKNSPNAKLVTSIPKILVEDVARLPIPLIERTAAEPDHKAEFNQLRRRYENDISTGSLNSILSKVQSQLRTSIGRSVVHNLLAFLAEQMIEMNVEKQKEIRGFLKWLERAIGVAVEKLSNKTKVRAYFEYDLNTLLDVLRRNRGRLAGADPTARRFQESVEQEYNASMVRLQPLLARFEATDRLIDQIVYHMYDLNDEEIRIVEGS